MWTDGDAGLAGAGGAVEVTGASATQRESVVRRFRAGAASERPIARSPLPAVGAVARPYGLGGPSTASRRS